MKKILKISVLIFVAFGAFTFASRTKANLRIEKIVVNNIAENASNELYIRNCARCHGADGAGQTESGQKLDVPDLTISGSRMSIAKITRIITGGEDEMPAFGKKLSKKQIANLAAYVRKL